MPTYTEYFMLRRVFYWAKLSNKQSAKVICRLIDLEQHTTRDKQAIKRMVNLSATHTFDCIVLRFNLTSCEELANACGI